VNELTELPQGWGYATLPELIGDGGVFADGDWVESKDQDPDGDVRLIQLADIGDGIYVDKSNRFLTRAKAVELGCTFLAPGDVLVARMPDPLGRACIFPGDKKSAVTVVDVCVIRPADPKHFSNRWLMYFLNAPAFRERIHALQSGSTRKRISRGNLSTLQLPVPPRAEQDRIVAKLDEVLSELDAGVVELRAAHRKLAHFRQSLLASAVHGQLTSDWRKNHSASCRIDDKAIPKNLRATGQEQPLSDVDGRRSLPAGWRWASVQELGDIQLGRQRSPEMVRGINPARYIRAANITEQGIDFTDVLEMDFSPKERQTFQLRVGDVLLTEASGSPEHVGRPVLWPAVEGLYCFQNTVIRFRPMTIEPAYAFWVLLGFQKMGIFRRLAGGVGINHLSVGKFSTLAVPVPPLEERAAIVNALSTAFEFLAAKENAIESLLEQSDAQRRNILQTAFRGELVTQDPADEPADLTLARVQPSSVARVGGPIRRRKRADLTQ
jgi:type I restriction enzyme, S subunit